MVTYKVIGPSAWKVKPVYATMQTPLALGLRLAL